MYICWLYIILKCAIGRLRPKSTCIAGFQICYPQLLERCSVAYRHQNSLDTLGVITLTIGSHAERMVLLMDSLEIFTKQTTSLWISNSGRRKTDPSKSLDSKSYNFTPKTIKIKILEYMMLVEIILVVEGKNSGNGCSIVLNADHI